MAQASLWKHPADVAEQPYSKSILSMHIFERGLPIAGVIGPLIPITQSALLKRSSVIPLSSRILASTSKTVLVTSGLLVLGTVTRMWGREEIEWQDRSWRLLENKGQCEVDDYITGVGLLGSAVGARMVQTPAVPVWKGAVGGMGIGSIVGTAMYMGWRYGVKGGKWN